MFEEAVQISSVYSKPLLLELILTILPAPENVVDKPIILILSAVLTNGEETVIFSFKSSAYSKPSLLELILTTLPAPENVVDKPIIQYYQQF